ncbi:MAG: glycosyltransferase family 4 protein [Nitrospirae bacterium]|nr:glycosyltransferase family 4 protein [Nitrospirota bacterium]
MKLLMISKALVVGAYHKKLDELDRLGIDLHLVIPTSWGRQKLEVSGGNEYKIYPMKVFFNGKNHFHFYRGLFSIINTVKPDIVHIDEEHYTIVTFQAMRLAKAAGAKTLFFTWQNIYKRYPFPFSWIESYNFRNADVAIAGNIEAKEVLAKKGFVKEVAVIPQFGVDPKMFQKMESSDLKSQIDIKNNTFIIGFMGRLVEEKGVLCLVDAVAKLESEFTLLFIGSGTLRGDILSRAHKLGLLERVKIIDQVPSIDVPQYLNCFDCLVLPSLTKSNWKEQFGRVLIEAMACEVPVIGSSSGEIPNVIGDAGLVFREGDTADLTGKLQMLLNDKDLRESLGKKGRERVLNNYTQKIMASATFEVYKKLLCS